MACRGCLECILKLLNLVMSITGLAMIGYGIYLLVQWNRVSSGNESLISSASDNTEFLKLLSLSTSILDKISEAWFIYLFVGIGVILLIVSCFGCIGAVTRNLCCLSCYAFLVIFLILVELGAAAFIFFDHNWEDVIPDDKTGNFDMIYDFLRENWKVAKWAALGAVIFQALIFLLALVVRVANQPTSYDSDDEYIAMISSIRQPLINCTAVPDTGVPVLRTLDHRPSRNDAWSQRMREKYGLDTSSEFTYNPSDTNRFQQEAAAPVEERSRCTIL